MKIFLKQSYIIIIIIIISQSVKKISVLLKNQNRNSKPGWKNSTGNADKESTTRKNDKMKGGITGKEKGNTNIVLV